MNKFDLLIVNKGISGLILASGLSKYLRIIVIDQDVTVNFSNISSCYVERVSFINIFSIRILKYLKIWNDNIKNIFYSVHNLEITKKNNIFYNEQIIFQSGYLGYLELGYIVNYDIFRYELIKYVNELSNITFLDSSNILQTVLYNTSETLITLNNGFSCVVKLVIGADGVDSCIRNSIGIPLIFKDIPYFGVKSIVQTEKKHNNTIRLVISRGKVIFLLPLKDPYCSFVFYLLPIYKSEKYLYECEWDYNCYRDLFVIRSLLGDFVLHKSKIKKVFPLRIQYTYYFIKHRLVLLGESAWATCPLIFYNINSELIDALILCDYLIYLRQSNKDIGDYFYLEPYFNDRKKKMLQSIINIIPYISVYDSNNGLSKYIYIFFYLLKLIPGYKSYILRYIMGFYDIPDFLNKKFFIE